MARTLSKNESRLILQLEWDEERILSLDDICRLLDATPGYARYVAHRLVDKGWLERLNRGHFRFIPADRGPQGIPDSNPFIVSSVLPENHFFSYGTACSHYGFTKQLFAEFYAANLKYSKRLTIRGTDYVLTKISEQQFFGFERTKVLSEPVVMATKERALLDALDRPQYAGGLGEVSLIVRDVVHAVSWKKVLEYLKRLSNSALIQRLGYLIELHSTEPSGSQLAELKKLMRPKSIVFLGPRRRWDKRGKVNPTWNIVENVPLKVLIDSSNKPLRYYSNQSDK